MGYLKLFSPFASVWVVLLLERHGLLAGNFPNMLNVVEKTRIFVLSFRVCNGEVITTVVLLLHFACLYGISFDVSINFLSPLFVVINAERLF